MSHVTHTNESCHTHEWVMSHTWMSHGTHMNESCHTSKIRACRVCIWMTWHTSGTSVQEATTSTCCSVLQCDAVCCSVLQCIAVSYLQQRSNDIKLAPFTIQFQQPNPFYLCCSVLQYVVVCCSVLQSVAVCCSVLQYVAMYHTPVSTV